MVDLNKLINDWKIKLSLENESIEWSNFPPSYFREEEHTKGLIKFNHTTKNWLILYDDTIKNHTFIHELGHIYLWKWLNHLDIIKTRKSFVIKTPTTTRMNSLKDTLLDCFVDYRLLKFDGFKKPYLEDCIKVLEDIYYFKSLDWSFRYYIYRYISYNCLIPKPIRNHYSVNINIYLYDIKNFIMSETSFDQDFFTKLDSKLSNFDKFKDTNNIQDIRNFTYEVLEIFPYWSKDQLSIQLNQLFLID